MEIMLSDFQEKQIDGLLVKADSNLQVILKNNVEHINFPFCYIRQNVETFSNIEKNIFIQAAKMGIRNIEEIDYIPFEQKEGFIQQLEDILIILG